MTVNSAVDILLIAVAIGWVVVKQLRSEQVKARLLVIAPLALAYFGIRSLSPSMWHEAADVALLALSMVVSAGLGVWRGRTITVWQDVDGVWGRRGSTLTLALWGALFAARGLLYVVDRVTGHPEASGAGALLLTLAIGFAGQNAVIALRMATVPTRPAALPSVTR